MLWSNDLVKCQALITIEQQNNTAVLIAVLLQAFPHNDIGLVRVDADVINLAFTIVQKRIQHAV